jgi:hypothetical protein
MNAPLDMATYERARRRANIAVWTIALQRRRLRSEEPEDNEFVFRKWADFDFLIVSLTRLRRAAVLASRVPGIRTEIQAALKQFDASLPGMKTMRDVAEHFDEYAMDKGKNKTVKRPSLEVSSLNDQILQWLGVELDTDLALRASEQLFSAIVNAKGKLPTLP